MAGNRYNFNDQGSTGDWFDQNHPSLNPGPMQTQSAMGAAPTSAGMSGVYGETRNAIGGGGGPEQFGGDYKQWFMALVGNRPWNQQTFNELVPTFQKYGLKITPPNAAGDQTKIQLPTGEWVRVGFGEGHPVWNVQGGTGGTGGIGGTGAYSGPGAIPPPFQAPSFADLQQEPGFQARYAMGLEGLQRSAAAQGSLLSGGTQKAINRYGQDFATGEYGAAYDRAYRTYTGNYQTQSADPWSRYNQLYQGGLNAALGSKTTPPLSS